MAERIFRGFLFLSRRIFPRIFSPDFFSSFLWEKVPRKILQENPRQNPPKFIQQKSPTHFCRGAGPTYTRQARIVEEPLASSSSSSPRLPPGWSFKILCREVEGAWTARYRLLSHSLFRKASDTFNFLRHAMRAIWSVRPKCSHRCVSLKETPLKPVQSLKPTTNNSAEQTVMRTKWFKHIAI